MKNKILFLGSLCLVLALGFVFTGCEDGGTQVVEYTTLGSPANVTATFSTSRRLDVKWDAVNGAESYKIVATVDGKNSILTVRGNAGGPIGANTGTVADLDKWEDDFYVYSYGTGSLPKGTWKIGVVAVSSRYDVNPSNPGWAATTITVP